jgi:predicted P-loop ATPase
MTKRPQSRTEIAPNGTAGNRALVAALGYAKRGWQVLPCRAGDKRPATRHGFKDATADKAALIRFWGATPDANIGIATGAASKLVVLDVDPRNGGSEQLHEAQRVHGDLPETLVAATGGGGTHYFFELPDGGLPCGVLADGLDLKAEGGYVVAAPSVHPSGATYRWLSDPSKTPLASCPDWIVEAMRSRARRQTPGSKPAPATIIASPPADARDTLLGQKFNALGLLGALLTEGKRSVVCLWQESHTTGAALDTSTVIFPAKVPGGPGVFHCSHSHCDGKTLANVLHELERRLALATPERAWMVELRRSPKGDLRCTFGNLVLILTHDSNYAGTLRLDEMRGVVMLGGDDLADATVSRMRVDLETRYAIQPGDAEMARAVQLVAAGNAFHPVRDFLKQLKWDGVPRLNRVATEILHVRAGSDEEANLSGLLVRRWFISLVARPLVPGCKVDTALILEGAQGIGKSSFFRIIAGDWFSDTEMGLDKDAMLQLRMAWIYEWAELENLTSRQSVSRVKAFLSSPDDRYRPPFGRTTVTVKRSGVIVGTTNTQDFLHDPSGSRRFWVLSVGAIDGARLRQEREQLLAEAVAAFSAGERYWLSEDEEARREALAERFVEVDPWEERVLEFAAVQDRVRTADVLLQGLAVPLDRLTRRDEMRVAIILRRAGYRKEQSRIDGKVTRFWLKPTSKVGRDGGDND